MLLSKMFLVLTCIMVAVSTSSHIDLSLPNGREIHTDKISFIKGFINEETLGTFFQNTVKTITMSGDRFIFIDSPGGLVDIGAEIIDLIEKEKTIGVHVVCLVDGEADSMAFNILSHCDERYATKTSTFIAHKIRVQLGRPATEKMLRDEADQIHIADEPYRQRNAKELHLSLEEYDKLADEDYQWSAAELVKRKYLNGIISINLH